MTIAVQPMATLLVAGQDVSGIGAGGYGWFAEEKYHNTQVEIIKSRDVATRVFHALDLASHPRLSAATDLDPAEFDAFVASLKAEGLPDDALADPVALSYLNWQTRISIAERLDDFALATTHRMERDRVLTEAVRLMSTTATQSELFASVDGDRRSGRTDDRP